MEVVSGVIRSLGVGRIRSFSFFLVPVKILLLTVLSNGNWNLESQVEVQK